MYYLGLLTITDIKRGKICLSIPNETIKYIWHEYIIEAYSDTNIFRIDLSKFGNLIENMAYEGKWQEVFDFLSEEINQQTKIRDYIDGEAMIKGFLMAYLSLTSHYTLMSEKEFNKGFADLYLEPYIIQHTEMPYSYLIEIKYFKRDKNGIDQNSDTFKNVIKEAENQLNRYSKDEYVLKTQHHTTVRKLILAYHGWELIFMKEV